MSWSTIAALLARLTQGMFDPQKEARIQVYVDDPAISLLGNEKERRRSLTIIIITWLACGFKLAFPKAKYGKSIEWIGAKITVERQAAVVSIPEDKVKDVIEMAQKIEKQNVTAVKEARSFAGKLSNISSHIDVVRPFINDVYGAVKSKEHQEYDHRAPENCIWSKQLATTTAWVLALAEKDQTKTLLRRYQVHTYPGKGMNVLMRFDASPWSMGGVLVVNSVLTAWFAIAYDENDTEIGHRHR